MKKLKILAIPFLTLSLMAGLSSCTTEGKKDEGEIDAYKVLPENVLNYEGDLDVLIYIEGQQGTMVDIGHKNYSYLDLWDTAFAKFYSAAKEFNRFSPKTRINIQYCSIGDYNNTVTQYIEQKGHTPHLMHATDHVNEMIAKGYVTDLGIYSDSPYYNVFDKSIMNEFNFGDFQGAVPFMIYPMGIFVNSNLLEKNYITYDDEYVESFTMEKFLDDMNTIMSPEVAGMSQPVEWLLSLSAPSVYKNYVYNQKVDLLDPIVNDLLEYENRLVNYSAYSPNTNRGWTPKENYNVHSWEGLKNLVNDEAYAFSAEMPWNIGTLHSRAEAAGKTDYFDLLPYPKANESTLANVGMLAEGLIVGNQCPVSKGECSEESINARDTAAYFAMFMNADPRAIRAKAEVEYTDAEKVEKYVGIVDLPMVKKNYFYNWGEDAGGDKDDVKEEIFAYQMELYLKHNFTYLESEDAIPDVENFSNLKPGFKKVLDIFYNHPENRVNFYGRPDNVPAATTTGTKKILADWEGRMFGDGTVIVGDATWTGWVRSNLSKWQNEMNANIQLSYELLKENMETYYEAGKYWK